MFKKNKCSTFKSLRIILYWDQMFCNNNFPFSWWHAPPSHPCSVSDRRPSPQQTFSLDSLGQAQVLLIALTALLLCCRDAARRYIMTSFHQGKSERTKTLGGERAVWECVFDRCVPEMASFVCQMWGQIISVCSENKICGHWWVWSWRLGVWP